jgi:hypothetical protein
MARTNITELASSVERAADSVLGSEADALRYAQKQLDDLTRQVELEIGGDTNSAALAAGENGGAQNESNRLARAAGNTSGEQGTNGIAGANGRTIGNRGTNEVAGANGRAGNNPQSRQRGEGNSANAGQNGNRGQQPNGNNNGEQASAGNQQNGQRGQEQATAGNNGQRGARGGEQQQANNNSPGQQNNSDQPGENGQQQGGQNGGEQAANGGGAGNADRLRQFAERLGQNNRAADNGGPITGNNFVNWSDQLRNVEQVLDPSDLRNQLATVRDRVGALRGDYRNLGRRPSGEMVRQQILLPLAQVRVWVQEELARQENSGSLVPLDRDPVPEKYSEVVRTYYEQLGSAK